MGSQDARQDRNRFPVLIGISGKTGTAAVGTEDIVQGRLNPDTGALYVEDITQFNVATGTVSGTTVTTTNTLIIGSNSSRNSFAIVPEGTTDLYIGFGTDVTAGSTGNGFPLLSNQIFGMDDYQGNIYGIVSAGTVYVKKIEV